jgi:V8-like Glu-specific endopeptidase
MALIDEYLDVARRWRAARERIEHTRDAGPNADSPERIAKFLTHQSEIAGGELLWGGVEPPPLTRDFGQERIIGQSDLISFNSLQKAIAIGRFVGRVSQRSDSGSSSPVGTGSMVSPRLMLTNNHVLPDRDEASRHVIEFNYQLGEDDTPLAAARFALAPDEFFATDKELDYTLVAVATTSDDGQALEMFGWSRLNGAEGKILKGHALNIIQHPEGAYKQIVLRGNRLLELCDHHFLYETDTLRGSSGAPVYSDQWEVVALHHRSVPNVVDGKVMSIANVPWTEQMPESQIAWIGNEGVRVSSLVRHIKALRLNAEQTRLRSEMLESQPPNPFSVSRRAMGMNGVNHAVSFSGLGPHGEVDISFPVQIRIRVGDLGVSLPP